MIITCPCKKKKFEIDAALIPDKGRTIQCGSCNHVWFYTPKIESSRNQLTSEISETFDNTLENDKNINDEITSQDQEETLQNISISENDTVNEKINFDKKLNKKNRKNSINFSKFLSYFLVLLISFVSIIILLDTLKSPLNIIFPDLEIILYNLFETIKDIYLFLENLIV